MATNCQPLGIPTDNFVALFVISKLGTKLEQTTEQKSEALIMYIPEPRKNKDGTWSIQLRINKQSIMVNADSAKECKRRAAIVKAEAQNAAKPIKKSELTLTQAIDEYINTRQNSLSPSTIRGDIERYKNELWKFYNE